MIAARIAARSRAVAGVRRAAVEQIFAHESRSVAVNSTSTLRFTGSTHHDHNENSRNKRDQWKWAYIGLGTTLGYAGVGAAFWTLEKDSLSAHAKAQQAAKLMPAKEIHGKWKQVEEVGRDNALQQMSLNWVFRQAATLLTNLDVAVDDETVRIVTQGGYVISITEKYGYDGGEYVCSRRDNRSGKHIGRIVESTPTKVVLKITWDDPYGGEMYETFELLGDGRLKQTNKIKVNQDGTTGKAGEWYTYYSIFVRQ
mmetsp:Transcript_14375/g.34044  ORF Transcript_14375/g.34044 Transcript_14375/m.34044 type:complete len:255 (-) Transcript_14375:193-957(-)